ncbi:MAG: nucleoside triphosphate pyrophosphohydrolase family protein [Gammaproteobacteria bacterium]
MNKHLQLVSDFRDAFGYPTGHGPLSDMTLVVRQAWLMDAGKQVLFAIKHGEMADILTKLTALAYLALNAIAQQNGDVDMQPVSWRHDGSVLSVMRLISDRINACSSGKNQDYSAVYCASAQLAGSFLNADFDKALCAFHQHQLDNGMVYDPALDSRSEIDWGRIPDLSECLYE